jgi:hypothetical protein
MRDICNVLAMCFTSPRASPSSSLCRQWWAPTNARPMHLEPTRSRARAGTKERRVVAHGLNGNTSYHK